MIEIVGTDEFVEWFDGLSRLEKESVQRVVNLLELAGLSLGAPHSSAIKGTHYPFQELRPKQGESPLRVLYAFVPRGQAVLLTGGCKSVDRGIYSSLLYKAESIWKEYLEEQDKEHQHEEKP